jgi:hypothetical protein
MTSSAALIARDQRTGLPDRILAGYLAGRSLLDLALAENTSPEVVRRVLHDAGLDPGPRHPAPALPDCLNDPDWLRAEYAKKGGRRVAEDLGCPRDAVYAALRAAGVPLRSTGTAPSARSGSGGAGRRLRRRPGRRSGSGAAIAALLGVPRGRVWGECCSARPRGRWRSRAPVPGAARGMLRSRSEAGKLRQTKRRELEGAGGG